MHLLSYVLAGLYGILYGSVIQDARSSQESTIGRSNIDTRSGYQREIYQRFAKADLTTTADLIGTYSWELILDIDNSQNAGFVERTVTVTTSMSGSYSNMVKSIDQSSISTSTGFDVSGVYDVISIGVKASVDTNIKNTFEKMVETKQEYKTETTKTDIYNVAAYSKLTLYRLIFNGPGMNYQTDTISSTPHQMDQVHITAELHQQYFLSDIDVVYTKDSVSRPANAIMEVDGKSPDINNGFDGDYVWLVPKWTSRPKDAVTGLQVIVQSEKNDNYKDLAKGANGQYRYLKMEKNEVSSQRIKEIALWRTIFDDMKPNRDGWQNWSNDINHGRDGDFLYLCWRTVGTLSTAALANPKLDLLGFTHRINVVDPILNEVIYRNVLSGSIYNFLGKVECNGIDGNTGLPIFETLTSLNGQSVDFAGSSLCNQSCSGSCVDLPASGTPVAPASAYPFSCDCANKGCNAAGPIPPKTFIVGTEVACQPDAACTCGNLPNNTSYTGYLCNWWNVANGQEIYVKVNAQYSPIRWCDCCPN